MSAADRRSSSPASPRARRGRWLFEAAAQGVAAARSHPLRAALAGLAIAAAVAAIATVSVALDGIARYARANAARAFGSDTFVVAKIAAPGQISRRELEQKLERNPDIDRADLRFLDRQADGWVIYGATASRRVEVAAGSRRFDGASLIAASAELATLRDLAIGAGRFFTPEEERQARQVVVLGAVIAEALFPASDPLGQRVRIAGRGFEVVGLQERQGNVAGSSLDRNVWIPLPVYGRLFGEPDTLQILARAPRPGEPDATLEAEGRARISLRARHGLEPGEEDDFDVLAPDAARGFVQTLSERIGVAAGPISTMALLAAILVVANTILVSVTQRTREIGVRRAVGASRGQILAEVLAESVVVSLAGGVAGLLLVFVAVGAARRSGLDLELSGSVVFASLAAASASGLVAGWYPARRATRIDVVEALRSE